MGGNNPHRPNSTSRLLPAALGTNAITEDCTTGQFPHRQNWAAPARTITFAPGVLRFVGLHSSMDTTCHSPRSTSSLPQTYTERHGGAGGQQSRRSSCIHAHAPTPVTPYSTLACPSNSPSVLSAKSYPVSLDKPDKPDHNQPEGCTILVEIRWLDLAETVSIHPAAKLPVCQPAECNPRLCSSCVVSRRGPSPRFIRHASQGDMRPLACHGPSRIP